MNNLPIQVIMIDDNVAFCEALQFWFYLYDHIDLKIYNDAGLFLDEHANYNHGVLLIDLLMPAIDGIALLEELQKRANKMPVIVISGHADRTIDLKAKALGAHEFLTKPFNTEELLNKIESVYAKYFFQSI